MKNIKSKIILVGIALMVAVTTLAASYTPINWGYFGLAVTIMAVLIWLQKRELKKTLTDTGDTDLSLSTFEESVSNISTKLNEISKVEMDEKYSKELYSILEDFMPNIDDYRLSLINELGIANYTKIIIPFAKAERIINRGVSAAIDGYLEESQKSISNSIQFLKLSIDEIKKIKVENNG